MLKDFALTASLMAVFSVASQAQIAAVISDCTDDSQLQAAVSNGGYITFSCSGIIPLVATVTPSKNTIIDATGQHVTIDGSSRTAFQLNSGVTLALNNVTVQNGDGLQNNGGTLIVTNSLLNGTDIGAITNISGVTLITNSTVSNSFNAIHAVGGAVTVTGSTLVGNANSGLYADGGGNITVANSILARNAGNDCVGSITDSGYNLSDENSCRFSGATSKNNVNPNLGSLQTNGGYTMTMAPAWGSPAIAAIPPGVNGCAAGLTLDQIGQMRPGNTSGNCTIGAFEYLSGTSPGDPTPLTTVTNCNDDSQLQAAVATGGRIVFACGGVITLTKTLQPAANITIDASGQVLLIDAGIRQWMNSPAAIVILNNISIADGNNGYGLGGAIYGGTVIVQNSTLYNNQTGTGGAIFAANVFTANSTFSNNNSNISPGGAIFATGTLSAVGNTFVNNGQTGRGGGAINFRFTGTTAYLANNIFSQNPTTCSGNVFIDGGYNIADDGTCGFTQPTSHSNAIPNLGSLSYNGGSANTAPPNSGSPALGAIPVGAQGCGSFLLTDERGVLRLQFSAAGDLTCDVGAYQTTRNNTTLTFQANPAGVSYQAQGSSFAAPAPFSLPFGTTVSVFAASQQVGRLPYIFTGWSDGGAPGHSFLVGAIPQTYTASFVGESNVALTSPSSSLGATAVCSSSQNQTCGTSVPLTFNVNAPGVTLGTPKVVTQGYTGLDFTAGVASCNSTACSVTVNFKPTAVGVRTGAVQFFDTQGDLVSFQPISGVGSGPVAAYSHFAVTELPLTGFKSANGIAVDASGGIILADTNGNQVLTYPAGQTVPAAMYSVPNALSVALDGAGNIYATDPNDSTVFEIESGTGVLLPLDGGNSPQGIAVDTAGDLFYGGGCVYVTYKFGASHPTVTPEPGCTHPPGTNGGGVTIDPASNVYSVTFPNQFWKNGLPIANGPTNILDNTSSLASDAAGNVYAVVTGGSILEYPAGDFTNPLVIASGFNFESIAIDSQGNLYSTDGSSSHIYKIIRSQPAPLTFKATSLNTSSTDSPQSILVQNIGNQPLAISNFSSDPNFAGYVNGSGANCPLAGLAPVLTCNLVVSFTPTQGGPLAATLTATTNVAFGPNPGILSIGVSGSGLIGTQTIQKFGTIPTQTVGTPLTLTATATSGLAVSYQSTTQTVCAVSGSVVTFLSSGPCSLTASQAGNNSYFAATPVTQQFTVNPNTATISNLQAVSVGGNSEVITWTSDQPCTTQVNYGPTSNYSASSPLSSNLVTFHSVTLANLSANTTYNYNVASTNSTGGTATSSNAKFTTTPYVGYVAFWGVNNSGVTISWSTDMAANTFVAYGTTTALGQISPLQSALSNAHGVVLTGLNPGTIYYLRAESTTAVGATGASTIYSFTTSGAPASPAPVITNVAVANITNSGATISWITDEVSTTQANYGTTTSYGSNSTLNSSLVTSHSVTLTNLLPGTTYDYNVISANSTGTSSGMSTNYTFATTSVIATPPSISNIQTAVTGDTATVTWTTDQASNSAVNYGASSTTPDSSYVTSHSVTLTNLSPGTLYNFTVVSKNAAGLSTTSPSGVFTTTASNAIPPYVGYVAFWGINNYGVTISWSTDVPANTQLAYGTTPQLGQLTPVQSTLANSHGVVLTNLAAGTTYYFVAQSTGANNATGYSTTYSFTTTGLPSAPAPNISLIQASVTSSSSAIITWNTDVAASSQVNYGVTASYSLSSALNTTLITSHSVTLTNLMPGTTYNFDVVSSNSNSLSSTSTNATFQTTGTAPGALISGVAASSITSSTALITWTTDQASTSVVNYGSQTVSDPALVTSHSLTLNGLASNASYIFSVTSVNAGKVSSSSSIYNFTTSTPSASAPVISYLAFWGVTNAGVTISWSTNVPSNTSVAYGTTNSLSSMTTVQTALSNAHGVVLNNLLPSTTYYFQAQSADVNGNTGYSTVYTFTTLAGGTPGILTPVVNPAVGNTATISWTTSVPTYSYVQYGPSSGNYNRYSARTALTTAPNCTLVYVPSGTVYYQLISTDAPGNQIVSPEATFVEP